MATTITLRVGNPAGPLTNVQVDDNFTSLKDEKIERDGSIPMTGKLTLVAPSSSRANMRVSEGSADPTSPAIGDIWNNNGTLKFRKDSSNTYNIITSETFTASGGTSTIAGDVFITGDATISGDTTISGSLTVNGTTTTINSTTVSVDDKNIVLADTVSPSDATSNGGGITLQGTTPKTLNWVQSTASWTSSENVDIATGKTFKINGTNVLSSTALGSSVVSSSLTSVGTIDTGVWQGTSISDTYLATISTAGKVSNSATTATGNSTASTIALRTGDGGSSFKNVKIDGTGSGTVTISGHASGAAGSWSFILPNTAGSANQVLTSNGAGNSTSWTTPAQPIDVQTFNSSGTWTKPSAGSMALVEIWGAGGGGGNSATTANISSGGGGGYMFRIFPLSDLTGTETVTVGAGGTGTAIGTSSAGGNGGSSAFKGILAYGGTGGPITGPSIVALGGRINYNVAGGTLDLTTTLTPTNIISTGLIDRVFTGGTGATNSQPPNTNEGFALMNSVYGGGGGAGGSGGVPGTSVFAGQGGTGIGGTGVAPAGGGSRGNGVGVAAGGSGAAGRVRVTTW